MSSIECLVQTSHTYSMLGIPGDLCEGQVLGVLSGPH
jgi:hypothetical protein